MATVDEPMELSEEKVSDDRSAESSGSGPEQFSHWLVMLVQLFCTLRTVSFLFSSTSVEYVELGFNKDTTELL